MPDVRYAIRLLLANQGFAAVAILSLALGIGANTALFSLIDAVMLRPLPVSHPEELLQVTMSGQQWFSNPIFEQIRDHQDLFSGVFAYGRWRFNLSPGGEARYVQGHYVSGQFFEILGIHAALGRTLTPADDRRGCPGAAVLSDSLWHRDYGGRADILGKTISLNGHPIEIVGVAESGFTGFDVGSSVGVLVPVCAENILHLQPANILDINSMPGSSGVYGWLKVVGRLKHGISAQEATARLKTLAPEILRATVPRHWSAGQQDLYLKRSLEAISTANGQSDLRKEYRRVLIILMATAGIVLLIACANVSNLLLARGVSREREIAIRMALGSGRGRLVRQLLTESLLLSGLGAVLGILFARWGLQLLVRFLNVYLDLKPDTRVLAFDAGVAVLTGLVFGIAPAWRGTRVEPQQAMKANSRGFSTERRAKFALGDLLVIAQVALALVLVAGAGLTLSTFVKLALVNPGFDAGHVLLTRVDFRNGNAQRERRTWDMLSKLREIRGVQAASISSRKPLCDCGPNGEVVIEGSAVATSDVFLEEVSDGYFATLDTPIIAGRDFTTFDTPTSPRVAIVNQSFAKRFFGATNPVGKHFRTHEGKALSDPVEIVGIVRDVKFGSLREDAQPVVYTAQRQDAWPGSYYEFELRAASAVPAVLIADVKSAIAQIDRDAVLEFTTLSTRVDRSLQREELLATLSVFFGVLALGLATIGIWGVMSYSISRRRNEIGIRMALGAQPGRVLRMVMGEAAILIGIGLIFGLGLTVATTRFVASFLYGMAPNDPLTLSLAVAVVTTVAAVAGYTQARLASRVEPLTALHEE